MQGRGIDYKEVPLPQKLRIAFVTASFPPEIGGISSVLEGRIKGLIELIDCKICVIGPDYSTRPLYKDKPVPSFPDQVIFSSYPATAVLSDRPWQCKPLPFWQSNIERSIEKFKPDIIHVEEPYRFFGLFCDGYRARPGINYAKTNRIPYTCMQHTNYVGYASNNLGFFTNKVWAPLIYPRLFSWIYNSFDAVFCHDTDVVIDQLSPFVSHERLKSCDLIGLSDWQFRDPERENKDTVDFVSIGRLEKEKHVDRLIKAFIEVNRSFPNTRLQLAGGRGDIYDEITNLNHPQILLRDFVNRTDVTNLYEKGDVYVTASCYDTCCVGTVEAAAAGLPLIVPKKGGHLFAREEQNCGALYDSKDLSSMIEGMKKMAANTSLRHECARNARKEAARFTQDRVARNMLKIWEEISGKVNPKKLQS